jgi:hypothetical protein
MTALQLLALVASIQMPTQMKLHCIAALFRQAF